MNHNYIIAIMLLALLMFIGNYIFITIVETKINKISKQVNEQIIKNLRKKLNNLKEM